MLKHSKHNPQILTSNIEALWSTVLHCSFKIKPLFLQNVTAPAGAGAVCAVPREGGAGQADARQKAGLGPCVLRPLGPRGPPWRQPWGKYVVSLVNPHSNATSQR
jgi:hypothetical protein